MLVEIGPSRLVPTAILVYLNHRFIGLPITIGVMVSTLLMSMGLVALDVLGTASGLRQYEESLLRSIDFSIVLIQGMLTLLLFAGALHMDSGHRLPKVIPLCSDRQLCALEFFGPTGCIGLAASVRDHWTRTRTRTRTCDAETAETFGRPPRTTAVAISAFLGGAGERQVPR